MDLREKNKTNHMALLAERDKEAREAFYDMLDTLYLAKNLTEEQRKDLFCWRLSVRRNVERQLRRKKRQSIEKRDQVVKLEEIAGIGERP